MSDDRKPDGKFIPGHGIKGGRIAGSRNRLTTMLLDALVADFDQFGAAAVKLMRIERPSEYVKVVASLVPKEVLLQESVLAEMSDEEILESLDIIRRLKARAATVLTEQQPDETKH
jgi:hypothetical protein